MDIRPTNKVGMGLVCGALVTIVAGTLRRKYGIELTGEEGAAYSLALTFIVQWFVRDKHRPHEPVE